MYFPNVIGIHLSLFFVKICARSIQFRDLEIGIASKQRVKFVRYLRFNEKIQEADEF